MAKPDALKRLGGGRWETRDGRFQIEPQSGTWVIVDTTQTNEFGLPLVRGPFGTLTAAREAVESAREEGPVESPLAERIEHARLAPQEPETAEPPKAGRSRAKATDAPETGPVRAREERKDEAAPPRSPTKEAERTEEPAPPPDPKWIRELGATDRRNAREAIDRLKGLEIGDAEEIARAEFDRREPALARVALQRQLRAAAQTARTPQAAVRAAVKVILAGTDDELGAEWRLIDGQGRRIDSIDLRD